MKKRIAAFLLSVLTLSVWLAASVPVFSIGEEMKVGLGTPEIDGEIDAVWKKASRQKLSHRTGGVSEKRENSIAWVSMLWDSEALYFLFELVDDDFTFDAPAGSEANDCVYLYIDEGDVFGRTWQKGQTRVCLTPSLGKSLYPMDGDAPRDYEMAFGHDLDGHWNIEFKYVPHTLDMTKLDKVLMDFQFNDADADGNRAFLWNWSDEQGECETDSASWTYVTFRGTAGSASGDGFDNVEDAAASISRTPIASYIFQEGTQGNHNEGPEKLWDGNVATKFCTSQFSMKSVVRLKSPTRIDGIIMATANDNAAYNGRNPDEWKIQGSNNKSDWVDIVTGDESFFDEVDFTYFAMPVECDEAYRYFRFYNRSAKSGTCQISEVVLCSTDEAVKAAAVKTEEAVPVDKSALVNYESPERLAARTPEEVAPPETQPEAITAPEVTAGGEVRQKRIFPTGAILLGAAVVTVGAVAALAWAAAKKDN